METEVKFLPKSGIEWQARTRCDSCEDERREMFREEAMNGNI